MQKSQTSEKDIGPLLLWTMESLGVKKVLDTITMCQQLPHSEILEKIN